MNVLIIGYGSAGKRHEKILRSKFKVDKIFIKTKQKIKNKKKVKFVNKIDHLNPDLVVVANETSKHINTCLDLEKKFKNKIIVVEKPLFNKFYNFSSKKNKYFVAYNLRFHPIIKFLKYKFKNKKPFYIESECSSYLPSWRNNRNYERSYSASKKMGGGTILDLSHEIDYISWIFNGLTFKKIISQKISNLKINSDDFSLLVGVIKNKSLVNIKLSYFHIRPKRVLNFFFSQNNTQIYADLLKSKLEIYKNKKKNTKI